MTEKEIREQFKLRLSGVEVGTYSFTVDCDKSFFELAELSDILDGHLNLQIEMVKNEKLVDLKFHFEGNVQATCDRCLLPVTLPMNFDDKLLVKLVPEVEDGENDDDDDIWVLEENTYEIDVFHFVYESIMLAMPIRVVHEDDEYGNSTCDPAVVKTLQEMSKQQDEEGTDPRWDALKNLKLED